MPTPSRPKKPPRSHPSGPRAVKAHASVDTPPTTARADAPSAAEFAAAVSEWYARLATLSEPGAPFRTLLSDDDFDNDTR